MLIRVTGTQNLHQSFVFNAASGGLLFLCLYVTCFNTPKCSCLRNRWWRHEDSEMKFFLIFLKLIIFNDGIKNNKSLFS
ncbi:hypothetical protein Avbf_09040 [Armadillidium vulgare]|nr:hypothetical protein Avbf_09040 [Armadillidium vulgare]